MKFLGNTTNPISSSPLWVWPVLSGLFIRPSLHWCQIVGITKFAGNNFVLKNYLENCVWNEVIRNKFKQLRVIFCNTCIKMEIPTIEGFFISQTIPCGGIFTFRFMGGFKVFKHMLTFKQGCCYQFRQCYSTQRVDRIVTLSKYKTHRQIHKCASWLSEV